MHIVHFFVVVCNVIVCYYLGRLHRIVVDVSEQMSKECFCKYYRQYEYLLVDNSHNNVSRE